MRLDYFFDKIIGSNRAQTIQVLQNCSAFSKLGLDVTLYAPLIKGVTIDSVLRANGLDTRLKYRRICSVRYLKFIINTLIMAIIALRVKCDIIYTRNVYFALLMSFRSCRNIFEAHLYRYDQWYHTLLLPIILRYLSTKDNFFMVVISAALRDKLREMGINAPMLVCHDGFEPCLKADENSMILDKMHYDAVAMYTGAMKRFKGLGHINDLARNNPNVTFILIGNTEQFCDRELVQSMMQLSNVQFIGHVEHRSIPTYLSQADILLLLPTKDGLYNDVTSPLKLFEYMASGKAVLATSSPSINEVLHHDQNALLAIDSITDIDSKFKKLIADKALRKSLGHKAMLDVQDYSWEHRVRKIINFITTKTI